MVIPMPSTAQLVLALTQSVGIRGRNIAGDVIRVQDALNAIPQSEGAPATLLHIDGKAGPKTCSAIQQLQLRHFGWKGADGRIDPGGRTAQLVSALLLRYGSTQWNIRRLEASAPASGNVAGVRTINSMDRFFEINDATGARRCLYFCSPLSNPIVARAHAIQPLLHRPELNMFNTACPCGPFSFIGYGTYSEFSPDANHADCTITVQPVPAHIANGPLTIHVRHHWIKPTSTPGAAISLPIGLQFVRDESVGEKKVPRR
jgi:hypothetical protein